jgi:hypothetical protein
MSNKGDCCSSGSVWLSALKSELSARCCYLDGVSIDVGYLLDTHNDY